MTSISHAAFPRSRSATLGALVLLAASASAAPPLPPAPTTLPSGGQVVAGSVVIGQAGNRMTIDQSSAKAILNWNSFDIGSAAAVRFNQPSASAVVLNRVLSNEPSAIYGQLSANGQVFLINPNGITFGRGLRVDVGGLVASTLSLADQDFLDGRNRFNRNVGAGGILNQGELHARYVALLAPEVRNEGVITANMGTVALAAGDAVTLNITGQDLVDVQVDKARIDTLVSNQRLVQADGGTVILSAQSAHGLLGQVVNSGQVAANGIVADGGTIRFSASAAISNTGSVSANAAEQGKGGTIVAIADLSNPYSRTVVDGTWSATGGRLSGDGGFIETSANHLSVRDSTTVSTLAPHGRAGQWLLDPNDFTIAAAGGDITGAALTAALTGGNVTITTTAGNANCVGVGGCTVGTAGSGDINVNAGVTIGAGNQLTLSAYRNINFNAQIAVDSNASTRLYLWYGMQASGAPGAIVVNSGGGTTGAGNNVRGGNFDTEAAHTYPVLGNQVYTAPPPPDTDVYVRATSGTSVYGDTPGFTYAIYDSVSGGNYLGLSPAGSVAWSTSINSSANVGSYSLTYTGNFSLSGYAFHPGTAATWTVTARPITATVSKTYDGSATFNSGFVITNLANNDTLNISGQTSSANAGSYSSLSNLSLGNSNYRLTGVAATITPRPLSATASKVYDGSAAFDAGSFTLSNVVSGETVSLSGSATTSSANAGTYSFPPGTLNLSSNNYSLSNVTAEITKRPLTISADDQNRIYGAANPTLTYSVTGFAPNENATTTGLTGAPTLATTATPTSPALVTYPITINPSGLSLVSGNYSITVHDGVLGIRPRQYDMWNYILHDDPVAVLNGVWNVFYTGGDESGLSTLFAGILTRGTADAYGMKCTTIYTDSCSADFDQALTSWTTLQSDLKASPPNSTGTLPAGSALKLNGFIVSFNVAIANLCPACGTYTANEILEWFGITP